MTDNEIMNELPKIQNEEINSQLSNNVEVIQEKEEVQQEKKVEEKVQEKVEEKVEEKKDNVVSENTIIISVPIEANNSSQDKKIIKEDSVLLKKEENIEDIIYQTCLSTLRIKIKEMEINEKSIMNIVVFAMEIIEKNVITKNINKKEFALKIIQKVVEEATLPNTQTQLTLLLLLNSGIVSNTIDLLIDATHGNIDINKIQKSCWQCFFTCFQKNNSKK